MLKETYAKGVEEQVWMTDFYLELKSARSEQNDVEKQCAWKDNENIQSNYKDVASYKVSHKADKLNPVREESIYSVTLCIWQWECAYMFTELFNLL